jgi:hypothetical protein
MTHTTTAVDRNLSSGSYESVVADIDITSLDNAASEVFDPATEFGFQDVLQVEVGQLENPGTYVVQVEQNNNLHVEQYGGTDPTSGTDVGVVRVTVHGDPGP